MYEACRKELFAKFKCKLTNLKRSLEDSGEIEKSQKKVKKEVKEDLNKIYLDKILKEDIDLGETE